MVKTGKTSSGEEDDSMRKSHPKHEDKDFSQRVAGLLETVPEKTSDTCIANWQKVKQLEVADFEASLKQIGENGSLLDDEKLEYTSWQEYGKHVVGVRNKSTLKKQGIVRTVDPNGSITEASYKDGLIHGIYRRIDDKGVQIQISANGRPMAALRFDSDFNLLDYNDP